MSNHDDPVSFDEINHREVSKVPYKVLDAPSLSDDFYLNLVDWSEKNFLAVGLGH
jgi:cell division cycle 20-like protein 1 (cofactor of APC complex)